MQVLEQFKNKKILKIFIITIIIFIITLFTGCTTIDSFRASFFQKKTLKGDNIIYIGVYEPETGDQKQAGKEEIEGIELANKMYHNIRGKEIRLIKVDSKSTSSGAKSAIESLVSIKPVAIIGNTGETASLIASKYVKKAKIPTVTPGAKNLLITEDNDYYFRTCITDSQIGEGLADYAWNKPKIRKFSIIYFEGDSTAESLSNGVKKKLNELNNNVSPIELEYELKSSGIKYKQIVKEIKEKGVKGVFMPVGKDTADLFFKEIEKNKMTDITFIGTKDWNDPEFIKMMKSHPKIKVAFTADSTVNAYKKNSSYITPETQKFIIEYKSLYGHDKVPTDNVALGYDSYLLIMNALNTSPSLKGEDVKDALFKTNGYRCATGIFSFDKNGNPLKSVNLATIKNGKVEPVYTTGAPIDADGMIKIKTK